MTQEWLACVFARARGSLQDDRTAALRRRLHDRLDLLKVVDVERGNPVAVFGRMVQQTEMPGRDCTSHGLGGPVSATALVAAALCMGPGLTQDTVALRLGWSAPLTDGLPEGWRPQTFKGIARHTRYTLVREEGSYLMKAEANASASGLIRPLNVSPKAYPILRWRWKVANLLSKADVTRKRGDDYPARIYVAFAYDPKRASVLQRIKYEAVRLIYGEYPPHAGLNYIWEGKAPVGTIVPNPFTDRVRMIVVDSGSGRLGQWVEHERNIHDDYVRAFSEEPPQVSGIAIMTDADNTGESAVAYYGDIDLVGGSSR